MHHMYSQLNKNAGIASQRGLFAAYSVCGNTPAITNALLFSRDACISMSN